VNLLKARRFKRPTVQPSGWCRVCRRTGGAL